MAHALHIKKFIPEPPLKKDNPTSKSLTGILTSIKEIGMLKREFEALDETALAKLKDRNQLHTDNNKELTNYFRPNPNPDKPDINYKFEIKSKIYELHIQNGINHIVPFIYNGNLELVLGSEVRVFYSKNKEKLNYGLQIAVNRSMVVTCEDKSYSTKLLLSKDTYQSK